MIKFFLLAAGFGKRARPLSLIKPKPLFPVCGIPLIERILEQLKNKGLTSGFVNLFYKSDEILNRLKRQESITVFQEEQLSGSSILSKAAPFLGDSLLLVINGDVFAEVPLFEMEKKIEETNSDGILLVRKNSQTMYSSLRYQQDKYSGVIEVPQTGIMYAGIALFRAHVVERIKDSNFFLTLDRHAFDIRLQFYDGIWLDIGDPLSYFQANYEYEQYYKLKANTNSNVLSENVEISKDSLVKNTIIWENTIIKNNSFIENSIVTGNTNLNGVDFYNKIITPSAVYDL